MSRLHRTKLNDVSAEMSRTSDYKPKHPMLNMSNVIDTSSKDHLDDFHEVNPFHLEEMQHSEISLGIGKALNRAKSAVKGKLAKRAARKAAERASAQAGKIAKQINKKASTLNKLNKSVEKATVALEQKKEKLRAEVNALISKAVQKYKLDEDTLRSDMEKHLTPLGQELL